MRICHVRRDVKESCNAIAVAMFQALGNPVMIVRVVERQLMEYTYIHPLIPVVSDHRISGSF